MPESKRLVCYLCGRDNSISSRGTGDAAVRCGSCGALLVDMVACPACGTKNRIPIQFLEHQKLPCKKCDALLPNSHLEEGIMERSASRKIRCNGVTIEGKIHQWKGEWETAIHLFQQAQKYSDVSPEARAKFSASIGLCHAYLGNYEKAAEYLEHVPLSSLRDSEVLYNLARAYGLIGDLDLAISCSEKACRLRTGLMRVQYLERLLALLYELRDSGPIALQTRILLSDARLDYDTENFQAGIQKLQRALELDPMEPVIYHQLGMGLLQQEQYEEAVKILERGLEFDPCHEDAQFALGHAYFRLGMYECALNAYKQTLQINPHNIHAYFCLGLVYEQQGDLELAKGFWEDVVKVDPTHQEALRCLQRCSQTV